MAQQPISKRCFCSTLTYLSSSFHFQVSHRHRRRRRRRRRRRHRSQVADGGVEQTRESGGGGMTKQIQASVGTGETLRAAASTTLKVVHLKP